MSGLIITILSSCGLVVKSKSSFDFERGERPVTTNSKLHAGDLISMSDGTKKLSVAASNAAPPLVHKVCVFLIAF